MTTQDSVGNEENKARRPELSIFNGAVSTRQAERPQPTLSMYPNPNAGELLRVELPASHPRNLRIRLVDARGRALRQMVWEGVAGQHLSLDLTDVPPGVYVVEVTSTDGWAWTGKVVVR